MKVVAGVVCACVVVCVIGSGLVGHVLTEIFVHWLCR